MKKIVLLSVTVCALMATSCDSATTDEGFKTANKKEMKTSAHDSIAGITNTGDTGGQGGNTPIKP